MDPPRRILVSLAAPEAFASVSRTILARMGYAIVTPEEFEPLAKASGWTRPDMLIVDERQLAEVPDYGDPAPPIVVLSGRRGVTDADPRVVGAVRRPAGLHDLYRLAQQVLEDTPRATPRVATDLPAVCLRDGRKWKGALLSISENGGLLRSDEPLDLGSSLELQFHLPERGTIAVSAEVGYQLLPHLGVVFNGTSPDVRTSISNYINASLGEKEG